MQQPVKPILKKPPGYKDPSEPPPPPQPKPDKPPAYRKPVLPPSFYHQKKKSSSRKYCRMCCCCVCISLLVLLVCLAVAGGIFYICFTPKPPVFRLRPVHFSRFGVTAEPDGTASLDARANVLVEVKNPNPKLTVYYSGAKATLSADADTELGSACGAGFTQGKGNITVLRFVTRTDGSQLVDLETGKRLNATVRNEAVKLNVEVNLKIGIGIGVGKLKVGMLPLDVACGGVSLKKLKGGDGPQVQIALVQMVTKQLNKVTNYFSKGTRIIDLIYGYTYLYTRKKSTN